MINIFNSRHSTACDTVALQVIENPFKSRATARYSPCANQAHCIDSKMLIIGHTWFPFHPGLIPLPFLHRSAHNRSFIPINKLERFSQQKWLTNSTATQKYIGYISHIYEAWAQLEKHTLRRQNIHQNIYMCW